MSAWNDWFHCMAHTYGTWLPGDPRGFRTRDHREHVEGDYKNPPPQGKYDERHHRAKQSMKRPPVILSPDARAVAVDVMVHALVSVHSIEVLAIAVGGMHVHVLARFESAPEPTDSIRGLRGSALDDPPRHYMGITKKESARALARFDFVAPGGVWARKGKIVPISDRSHQRNAFDYILDHKQQGAATWSFRDPVPAPPPKPTD